MQFPGFPCNDFNFHFEEAGGALAGIFMRDSNGNVISGILPNRDTLLDPGTGWQVIVQPHVAVRSKALAVLIGGSSSPVFVDITPAAASLPRRDVIYTLPADVGAGDPVTAVGVSTGTPGTVPSKPSIPAGAVEIGEVRVGAGITSILQATITETFRFAALAGGDIRVRTVSALTSYDVLEGTRAYVMATDAEYVKVDGAWYPTRLEMDISLGTVAAGGVQGNSHLFGVTFPKVPSVVVNQSSPGTNNLITGARSVTRSSFTSVVWNRASSAYSPSAKVIVIFTP